MAENSIIQFVGSLVVGLFLSVVTAWLTVRFSLQRFHAERWWERKLDAYTAIIESLHHMLNYFSKELEASYRGGNISEETAKALQAKYRQATEEIDKATDIGSFVISSEAADRLRELRKARDKANDAIDNTFTMEEIYEPQLSLVRECLNSIRDIAHRDLGAYRASNH